MRAETFSITPAIAPSSEVMPGLSDGRWRFVLAFFAGLTTPFSIRLVGLMPLSEILLLAVAGFTIGGMLFTGRLPVSRAQMQILGIFLVAQFVGLLGYVVSDTVRGSAPVDMLRGWSRMIFLAINICSIAVIFGHSRLVYGAWIAGVIASAVHTAFGGVLFNDYWKFGFGLPVTLLVILAAPRVAGLWGAIGGCMLMGIVHFFMDFRGMTALCIANAGLLSLFAFGPLLRRVFFAVGFTAVIALLPLVIKKVTADTANRATRSNVERSAMLQAAWEGFLESPLIGQGSWFSKTDVMYNFLEIRTENARLAGVGGFKEDDAEGLAIHSQMLVALAEGGVFGAAFFFVYGLLLIWAIQFCVLSSHWNWLQPAMLFTLLLGWMNLCISPFSGAHRVEIAAAAGVIMLLWNERQTSRSAGNRS
jgi:hypothetical protein